MYTNWGLKSGMGDPSIISSPSRDTHDAIHPHAGVIRRDGGAEAREMSRHALLQQYPTTGALAQDVTAHARLQQYPTTVEPAK